MKLPITFVAVLNVVLVACSSSPKNCEDVTVAKEQIQQCQALQRQIVAAKDKPIIRTELERRYQQDCVEIRYYRESHQDAICGNKKEMQALKQKGVID